MKSNPIPRRLFLPTLLAAAGCGTTLQHDVGPANRAAAPVSTQEPTATPTATGYEQDPALLRREILKRLDARIDEAATRAHLDARLSLDEAMPIPYLGVDADPTPGGMRVTAVYGATGAESAGIRTADVITAIDGETTDRPAAFAHAIRSRRPGQRLRVEILRDGKAMALDCPLGRRPEEDEDEDEQFPDLPQHITADTGPFRCAFDDLATGPAAGTFDSVLGGHGADPRWIVTGDANGRWLQQACDDPTGLHFPMAIVREFFGSDVAASARMRYAGGKLDRAGGIVLRYRDPGNYYVARVNAAEGDLRIFRVANGIRRTLPGGIVKAPTDDGEWHRLEFRVEGSQLTATLDGRFTATAYDSFFLKGRAGLWTKSDSITDFDDVVFEPITRAK